jgi:hypothetical protein
VRWLGVALLVSFIISTLFIAPFIEYRKPHAGARLILSRDNTFMGEDAKSKDTYIFLQLCVRNLGDDSIAENFRLEVIAGNQTVLARNVQLPDPFEFTDVDRNKEYVIHRSDLIEERTATPVIRGGLKRGWVAFAFPGVNFKRLGWERPTLVIKCQDVAGKEVSLTDANAGRFIDSPVLMPGAPNIEKSQ